MWIDFETKFGFSDAKSIKNYSEKYKLLRKVDSKARSRNIREISKIITISPIVMVGSGFN